MANKRPFGNHTRGTTNPNRLRRIDRYIASLPVLRNTDAPIVVDLGFGASPITAIELLARIQRVNASAHVVGIEIDRERVERAEAASTENLHFLLGGFETPLPAHLGSQALIIRALNVLRQYDESEVAAAWQLMQSRISDDGVIIEGTCDEIGRLASWVTLDKDQPISLTISLRTQGLELPSKVAERLPKVLIHRNVAGEPIHQFLQDLDRAWLSHAGIGAFSSTQRWVSSCKQLVAAGWPLIGDRKRWRLGEVSVKFSAVAPN